MQILKFLVLLASLCWWNMSNAASLKLTGRIVADKPVFKMSSDTNPLIENVMQAQLSLKQTNNNKFCTVTTDLALARQGAAKNGPRYCYLEWTNAGGLAVDGDKIKGVIPRTSDGKFYATHQVSFFSGSEKTKVILTTSQQNTDVAKAVKPVITKYETFIGGKWITNNEVTNHNPMSEVSGFRVTVEPRPFSQKVVVEQIGNCIVAPDASSCLKWFPSFKLGDPNIEDQRQGTNNHGFLVNSINNYWTGTNVPRSSLQMSWLYAAAKIVGFAALGVSESQNSSVFDVQGSQITVENGKARVVLAKPSAEIQGDFWMPVDVSVTFNPNGSREFEYRLDYEGNTLFRPQVTVRDEFVKLDSHLSITQQGDFFLYDFSVDSVPDGNYDVTVNTRDQYNLTQESVFTDGASFNRYAPMLNIFKHYIETYEGDSYFFNEDLLIAAFNGYKDDVTIKEVLVNGQSIGFTEVKPGIAQITSGLNPQPGESVTFDISIEDTANNTATLERTLVYAPMVYELASDRRNSERDVVRSIQLERLALEHKSGERCRFYDDIETAARYAAGGRLTCVVNWTETPASFVEVANFRSPSLAGYIDTPSANISYDLLIVKDDKSTLKVGSDTLQISTLPAETIVINSSSRDELINDELFPVDYSGDDVVKAITTSSPGSMKYSFAMNGYIYEETRNPNTRTGDTFVTSAELAATPNEVSYELWDIVDVDIEAKYERLPSSVEREAVKALIVPDEDIGVALDFQDDEILSTDNVTAKINVGIYNRVDGWVFDGRKMGEWEVYIGKYSRGELPEPVTETVRVNADGEAYISMPMEKIGLESSAMMVVAKAIDPIDGYDHYIQSGRSYFVVYKGTKIDGDLVGGLIREPVPLRASVSYIPETREDIAALGNVIWEASDDGQNWQSLPEFEGELRWRNIYDEEALEYIRVTVENKFTGETITTEPLKIIAYNKPDLIVEQTNEALDNEGLKFKLYDYKTPVTDNQGVIQWSLDDRATWFEGSSEETFFKEELVGRNVYARMRYHGYASDDKVKEESFAEARVRYSFLRAPRIYFDLQIPELVEEGKQYDLAATATTRYESMNDRIVGQWLLPDGSIVEGNDATFAFDSQYKEGRNFIVEFQAWVEGSRAETFSSARERVNSWTYDFPEVNLRLAQPVQYAPSEMSVWVSLERHFAPGVQYSYELQPSSDFELIEQIDERYVLRFDKVGIFPIQVKVANDRGQKIVVEEMIEVLPPQPLEVDIVKTFSNEFMRFPLDISLRARVYLGHPEDSIKLIRWYLDGTLIEETTRHRSGVSNIQEGEHRLRAEVETEFGQFGEQEFTFTVIPNTPPTGQLSVTGSELYNEIEIHCNDQDGRILAYVWLFDDVQLTHGHSTVHIDKDKVSGTSTITGRCYDDSGDYFEASEVIYGNNP